jgi:F0F1-type ATP synthase membrane subunit b/b'
MNIYTTKTLWKFNIAWYFVYTWIGEQALGRRNETVHTKLKQCNTKLKQCITNLKQCNTKLKQCNTELKQSITKLKQCNTK